MVHKSTQHLSKLVSHWYIIRKCSYRFHLDSAMALQEIGPIMLGGTPEIITFFRTKRVLARMVQCISSTCLHFKSIWKGIFVLYVIFSCNRPMAECPRGDIKDAVGWKCHTSKGRISIRTGSFFSSKSHLTLQQWMMLIHYWARKNPVCDAAESSGVGKNTAIDVYQWLREVCST